MQVYLAENGTLFVLSLVIWKRQSYVYKIIHSADTSFPASIPVYAYL